MELTHQREHASQKMNLEKIEEMVIRQNIAKMSPSEKIVYVKSLNDALGLDWRLNGIGLINLQGKEVPYIQRAGTDQLRQKNKISITITAREKVGDCYVVTARATTPDGRTDESIGVVPLQEFGKSLSGDKLANAFMKAETKAKRRVTLSICGCGFMDESETETVEHSKVNLNPEIKVVQVLHEPEKEIYENDESNEILEPKKVYDASSDERKVTQPQLKRLFAISKSNGWDDKRVDALVSQKGFESRNELTRAAYNEICELIEMKDEMPAWEDMGEKISKEEAFSLYQDAYRKAWTKDQVTEELRKLGFHRPGQIAKSQLENLKNHFATQSPKE